MGLFNSKSKIKNQKEEIVEVYTHKITKNGKHWFKKDENVKKELKRKIERKKTVRHQTFIQNSPLTNFFKNSINIDEYEKMVSLNKLKSIKSIKKVKKTKNNKRLIRSKTTK